MKQNPRGVITIFLSLVLLPILALIFTSLESARSEGLKLRVMMCADTSLQSAFAMYDELLWNEYGLLLFASMEEGELCDIVCDYAVKNSGQNTDVISFGKDLFAYSVEDVSALTQAHITDDNGELFRKCVCEYMREAGIAEMAKDIFSRLELSDEKGLLDEISDSDFSFDAIEEKIEQIEEDTDNANPDENKEAAEVSIWQEEAEEYYDNLLDEFADWAKKGLLALVIDDTGDVSTEKLDMTMLPSDLPNEVKSEKSVEYETEALDSVLFNEYIIRKADCYTSENRRGLEIEYILKGYESDCDNLLAVVTELVGLRMVPNTTYYLTSASDMAIAEAIAAAAFGWTMLPALVEAVKVMIILIWSLRDAISEVRTLLAGGTVPLLKASHGEKPGAGLSYEDYLRILLLLSNREKTSYRMMDVIQRNIRTCEPDFYMQNCVYAAQIKLTASSRALFPLLPTMFNHEISCNSGFSYGAVTAYVN